MTLFQTLTQKSPFCDNAEQPVFSQSQNDFFSQRLDKHRLLTVAIVALYK